MWIALVICFLTTVYIKKPTFSNLESLDVEDLGYAFALISVFLRGYIVVLNKKLSVRFRTMNTIYYTNIVMFICAIPSIFIIIHLLCHL